MIASIIYVVVLCIIAYMATGLLTAVQFKRYDPHLFDRTLLAMVFIGWPIAIPIACLFIVCGHIGRLIGWIEKGGR